MVRKENEKIWGDMVMFVLSFNFFNLIFSPRFYFFLLETYHGAWRHGAWSKEQGANKK
jgi:hypothetical protein